MKCRDKKTNKTRNWTVINAVSQSYPSLPVSKYRCGFSCSWSRLQKKQHISWFTNLFIWEIFIQYNDWHYFQFLFHSLPFHRWSTLRQCLSKGSMATAGFSTGRKPFLSLTASKLWWKFKLVRIDVARCRNLYYFNLCAIKIFLFIICCHQRSLRYISSSDHRQSIEIPWPHSQGKIIEDHQHAVAAAIQRQPSDWNRPVGRPSSTWLCMIEADQRPLNISLLMVCLCLKETKQFERHHQWL